MTTPDTTRRGLAAARAALEQARRRTGPSAFANPDDQHNNRTTTSNPKGGTQ